MAVPVTRGLIDDCGDSTFGEEWITDSHPSAVPSVYVDQTVSHTGPCSYHIGSQGYALFDGGRSNDTADLDDSVSYIKLSCWIRFENMFNGTGTFIQMFDGGSYRSPHLRLSANAAAGSGMVMLTVRSDNTTPFAKIGTSTAVLTGVWYRFGLCYKYVAATDGSFRDVLDINFYLDGVLQASTSHYPMENVSHGRTQFPEIGAIQNNTNSFMHLDDVYMTHHQGTSNNTTPYLDLVDHGDVRVTYKAPVSNYINQFGTGIGANPANRWENVDNRPVDLTIGWRADPPPANQQIFDADRDFLDENYGIQTAAQGDVDLTAVNVAFATDPSYPSNLPAVGIRLFGTPVGETYKPIMQACGMKIAYTPTSILATMSWYYATTIGATEYKKKSVWHNGINQQPYLTRTITSYAGPIFCHVEYYQDPHRFYSRSVDPAFIFSDRNSTKPMIFHSFIWQDGR